MTTRDLEGRGDVGVRRMGGRPRRGGSAGGVPVGRTAGFRRSMVMISVRLSTCTVAAKSIARSVKKYAVFQFYGLVGPKVVLYHFNTYIT